MAKEPWKDFIPSYKQDNAKGYNRYTDKLAGALNETMQKTLPDASEAEDGQTLVVDDGKWTIGEGGGGSGGVDYVSMTTIDETTYLNRSYNALKEDIDNNIMPTLKNVQTADNTTNIIFAQIAYLSKTEDSSDPSSNEYEVGFVNGQTEIVFLSTDPETLMTEYTD